MDRTATNNYGIGRRNDNPPRPFADPIGMQGFSTLRLELDWMVVELCSRLKACGKARMRGKQLAAEMNLPGTRAVRRLVAYAHVHHRVKEIVGVPGSGYVWGPNDPKAYETMTVNSRRMGRCYFFNAALYGHDTAAIEAAQMMFSFMEQIDPADKRHDELAALVASQGVSTAQVLDAIIQFAKGTDEGKKALAEVANKHADVLTSKTAILKIADETREKILSLVG